MIRKLAVGLALVGLALAASPGVLEAQDSSGVISLANADEVVERQRFGYGAFFFGQRDASRGRPGRRRGRGWGDVA